LFADQPVNAARVAAVGAGRVVAPPQPESLRAAIEDVLADAAPREAARRIAADLRSVPPVDAVVGDVLAAAV
jgi:UDP:flavonoid glycosyltransferase YjiC (YdhE family)